MVDQFPLQSVRRSRLRAALLGTAAAGVLLLGYGRRAYAQSYSPPSPACTTNGTEVTCSGGEGDLSGGINVDGGTGANAGTYDYLKIENLTEDIAPASTVDGVQVTGDGDFKVYTEASDYKIETTGVSANGIYAYSHEGAVTVVNNLAITTDGSNSEGIDARSDTQYVKITNEADATITTYGGNSHAIFGYSKHGYVVVDNYAALTTKQDGKGIYARTGEDGGDITVTNSAAISTAEDSGNSAPAIIALAEGTGYVRVTNKAGGTITTWGNGSYGIYAYSDGGTVKVFNHDTITTHGIQSHGIYAKNGSDGGDIRVYNHAAITVSGDISDAIRAYMDSDGNVTVKNYAGSAPMAMPR